MKINNEISFKNLKRGDFFFTGDGELWCKSEMIVAGEGPAPASACISTPGTRLSGHDGVSVFPVKADFRRGDKARAIDWITDAREGEVVSTVDQRTGEKIAVLILDVRPSGATGVELVDGRLMNLGGEGGFTVFDDAELVIMEPA